MCFRTGMCHRGLARKALVAHISHPLTSCIYTSCVLTFLQASASEMLASHHVIVKRRHVEHGTTPAGLARGM